MIIKSIWLRRIHKWIGLVIALQFLAWAISGAAMALLAMDDVAGGAMAEHATTPVPATGAAWKPIQRALGGQRVERLSLGALGERRIVEVHTAGAVRLFDAANGAPVVVDRAAAAAVARAAYPGRAAVKQVVALSQLSLPVRAHALPIWQVDFSDPAHSSFYVSGTTGALLERRNDSWRWWDFFWMLHNMDYAQRTSFNHPLIITVGIAMAWLAVTGFWLLFRTMWRHDFAALRRRS